jgi:hypothetical protein
MAFSDPQDFACLPREISKTSMSNIRQSARRRGSLLRAFTGSCLHEEPALAATALPHRRDHNAALLELRGH